jgi:branched-chain amino acid aminotransferase
MAFDFASSTAYFEGSFVPMSEAKLSIASSPVLYGLTVYTVFSANWNAEKQKLYIFRLRDHYTRLIRSARIMDFDDFEKSCSFEAFQEIIMKLIKRNQVREDVLVRVAIYVDEVIAGTKIHGLKNSLSAFVYPFGTILNPKGIDVCVSSWTRTQDNAQPSRAKINGSYINASLMKNEALLNGYDEAIALDSSGHVTEGTVANLFIIRDGALITPDKSTDLLEGITRSSVLEIAHEKGIKTEQRPVDRSELYIADEMFMCGSSARIVPILSVDKRPVGTGKQGAVTRDIAKAYRAAQFGETPDTNHWLTEAK